MLRLRSFFFGTQPLTDGMASANASLAILLRFGALSSSSQMLPTRPAARALGERILRHAYPILTFTERTPNASRSTYTPSISGAAEYFIDFSMSFSRLCRTSSRGSFSSVAPMGFLRASAEASDQTHVRSHRVWPCASHHFSGTNKNGLQVWRFVARDTYGL